MQLLTGTAGRQAKMYNSAILEKRKCAKTILHFIKTIKL